MGDNQECDSDPFLDADQLASGFVAQFAVERGQRLVEQQQLGHLGERPRQRHALALAAGKLVWPPLRVIRHLDQSQHLIDARVAAATVHPLLAQAKGNVGGDVQVREQRIGLKHHVDRPRIGRQCGDIDAVDDDPAAVGRLQPGDYPQQGRLAAARRPE